MIGNHAHAAGGAQTAIASPQPGLELRPLTVMFCDMAGSTELSFRLDPEELSNVLVAYRETCGRAVERYGGFVARFVGDSLLVYFGYPKAHDDDAVRATHAALAILHDIKELGARLNHRLGADLSVHIGIHTGPVVAGELGFGALRESAAVVGTTPNIAARLQSAARPGEIVVSESTFEQLGGQFDCERMSIVEFKGIAAPLAPYRVLSARRAPSSETFGREPTLQPLGRDLELELLNDQWAKVIAGQGQVALVRGEAGIGKTRLLQAFVVGTRGQTRGLITCQCSPFFANSAFFPLVDLLRRSLKLDGDLSTAQLAERLQAQFDSGTLPGPETMPLLASMLLAKSSKPLTELELPAQAQREMLIEWLLGWITAPAATQPVIMIVEDVHLADASTLDFLSMLLERIRTAPVFLMLSFRSEFLPFWPNLSHVRTYELSRLSPEHVRAMLARLTVDSPLPAALLETVISKTDGVPLFVEELTKMVIESARFDSMGGGPQTANSTLSVSIPATLHGSLIARLDRHATAKGIAQVAAVIGRGISFKLIRAVAGMDDAILEEKLALLVSAELLYQRGTPPNSTYSFKHSLILDAAYQSLLKSKRAHLHKLVAAALLEQFPAVAGAHPELVARHLSEAGLYESAVTYWRAAGSKALEASASIEAAAHLNKGLADLAALPESSRRAEHEVALQVSLGTALTAIKGYGSSDVEKAYARAHALCENISDSALRFAALTGLHTFYQVHGPLRTARDIAEQLVELADPSGDATLISQAHRRLGWTLFCLGEMHEGKSHLDRVFDLFDATRSVEHSIVYGAHPWVVGFANAAWLEWVIGRPEAALRRSEKSLALARQLGRPLLLAYALCMSAAMRQCRGEPMETLQLADEAAMLALDNSMPYWSAWSAILRGWAMSELGRADEGIVLLRDGLTAYRETGAELFRPHALALLAHASFKLGRHDEALYHLDEALECVEQQNVHFYSAEIHRLRGEVLAERLEQRAECEACFQRSLAIAIKQGALSFELRTAVSLSEVAPIEGQAAIETALARCNADNESGLVDVARLRLHQLSG